MMLAMVCSQDHSFFVTPLFIKLLIPFVSQYYGHIEMCVVVAAETKLLLPESKCSNLSFCCRYQSLYIVFVLMEVVNLHEYSPLYSE
jgi:hypothetical protein